MRRREFIALLGGAAIAWPSATRAQEADRIRRIGVLTPSEAQWEPTIFREALRDLGYVEGMNLILDVRSAEGKMERLPGLARELSRTDADVIVAVNTPGARAAIDTKTTRPIVMAIVGNPVATGFVTNIRRPGGNVTGVSNMGGDLAAKRLALLKEAVPTATRIAVLLHPDDPIVAPQVREIEAAAGPLGVRLRLFPVRDTDDLEHAVQVAVEWPADALFRLAGQTFPLSRRTAELALQHRLPAMLLAKADVEAGALMSYYPDHAELWRRVADYVGRILKGTPPGELPIEQPTKFELVINLKTAQALGIELPPTLLARADEVIE